MSDTSLDAMIPQEIARKAESAGVVKANLPFWPMISLAVLAGAFISMGAVFATVLATGSQQLPYGVGRLLIGFVFSLGLILVVGAGAELFTGNNLIVMAWASGKVTTAQLLRNWGIVYLGNFIGAVATALLLFVSEQYRFANGAVGLTALNIAHHKVQLSFVSAVALGIACNALVCLAVWLCMGARSMTDKIVAILFPISAFVAAGFEHSIANLYFVPLGLLIKRFAPPDFWQAINLSADNYPLLTWSNFFVNNLLPVTLGNIIGGAGLVGLIYWLIYLRPTK